MKKNYYILVVFCVCFLAATAMAASMTTTASGLRYVDDKVGDGAVANTGSQVTVHYTGWVNQGDEKGKKFDSSVDKTKPFQFMLGFGTVIKGWDEGVAGMKVGGKRTLYIPANLAYGSKSIGDLIPANSDLIFEVELLKAN